MLPCIQRIAGFLLLDYNYLLWCGILAKMKRVHYKVMCLEWGPPYSRDTLFWEALTNWLMATMSVEVKSRH